MSADSALGLYKATVKRNDDPRLGKRIIVFVPQVLGTADSEWAEPVHSTGIIPALGSVVWVQFSGGDVTKPVYQDTAEASATEPLAVVAQATAEEAQAAAVAAKSAASVAYASADVTLTATYIDLTGAVITLTVGGPSDVYLVMGTFDMDVINLSTGVRIAGTILVDGVRQTQQSSMYMNSVSRVTTPGISVVTGLSEGSRIFKLQASKSLAAGTAVIRSVGTSITVLKVSA